MPKIVRFHRLGGPEELRLEEAAPETPQAGEVRIRVQAVGLNNSEAQLRRGDYPMLKASFPSRIGRECAGIVDAVAPDVESIRVGDLVSTIPAFDIQRNGVYGDWCVVPQAAIVRVPPGMGRIEAAAVWQQYLTAYGPLVEYGRADERHVVLITAGASSVGLGAIQMAKTLGCKVVATTRSAGKTGVIRRAGADHVIVTETERLASSILDATGGKGFDLALDPIAGPGLEALAASAASGATIFLYGQLAPEPTPFPLVSVMRKGLSIRGYTLWEITLDPARRERAVRFICDGLETKRLQPIIDRVFDLSDIVAAHRYLESGRQAGKIVVTTGGPSE